MTFRRRLALLSASATLLAVLVSAIAVYVIVRQQLHADIVTQLEARVAVHAARDFTNVRELTPLEGPALPQPPTVPRLISASGEVLVARYPALEYPITAGARAVATGQQRSFIESVRFRDDRFKVLTVPAGTERALQIAQSLASVDGTLDRLRVALVAVVGAAAIAAPLVGLVVAGGSLRPVRRLTRAADDIARTGDLQYRIEAGAEDELGSLASSFNAMLDRLAGMMEAVERARQSQRQLAADVSHELRTPLASLRANVELLALGRPGDPERAELVTDILEQLEALTTLVSQLIELAREDLREPERVPLALDEVVREAIGRARRQYPHVPFVADLEPLALRGAPDALTSAISNLLDNAAKASADGSTVEVTLRDGVLHVRDHGSGIGAADLPHVFERFYRGSDARSRPGSGLGLAIVAQVVAAHGGEVHAEPASGGGALFSVQFPRTLPADS